MSTKKLKIHSENILPILKKWLYSERDIFVRELISNACDAISKLGVLGIEDEHRIDVTIDSDAKTLTFSDTGLGMTKEEVEKYIAQLAFSGAEDFIEKYSDKGAGEQIIGHFGLGFYSTYMVAHTVELDTLSYQEGSTPTHWKCDGSSKYTIKDGKRDTRGTTITLHLEDTDYLDEGKIKEILKRFCSYLPYPIYLGEERINPNEPLWLKKPSECTDQEYIEFYRQLYPMEQDPIFWIHLSVDYPFHLQGILYFPKITNRLDMEKSAIQLYCNRVFVSDNCKDIIPDYLMVLRGVIDSPDIPLNVSRSCLQVDRTVRQLMGHISKKVSDKLSSLYKNEREKFLERWPDIELIIKLGALQDEKFYEKCQDFLVWQNTADEWTTIKEYCERCETKHKDKIFYTTQPDCHTLSLYTSKGIEVLQATSTLDTHVINMLEQKCAPVKFQRIDGAIDETICDPSEKETPADLVEFFRAQLSDVEVEAKSLTDSELPAFVMIDENTRRMRDAMAMQDPSIRDQFNKHTFVVNTNSPLIETLSKTEDKELAKELTQHLYELSLLGQRELKSEQIKGLIERSNRLLTTLVQDK